MTLKVGSKTEVNGALSLSLTTVKTPVISSYSITDKTISLTGTGFEATDDFVVIKLGD